jgi:hypothetical protein
MLFSCMSLIGMQLLDWKYNQVQARLEQQFQGRQWAAQHGAQVQMNPETSTQRAAPVPVVVKPGQESAGQSPAGQGPAAKQREANEEPAGNKPVLPTYSQPGQLVISLWPLRLLAMAALVLSSVLLWRQTHQSISLAEKQAP